VRLSDYDQWKLDCGPDDERGRIEWTLPYLDPDDDYEHVEPDDDPDWGDNPEMEDGNK
jgi:hypothetical protein